MDPAIPDSAGLPDLIPDRGCGACNVCCVALTIDDPALQKAQGYRCRNATRDNGCVIYDTRPDTCRSFFCGWRRLTWVRGPLRSDLSGVLVRLHYEVSQVTGARRPGIILTLLDRKALKADGLAETVAAAVAADIVVILEVPGAPGHTYGRARLNEALSDVVYTRDKAGLLEILRIAYAQGRAGTGRPITFTTPPAL